MNARALGSAVLGLIVAAIPPDRAVGQDSVSLVGAVVRVSASTPPMRQRVGRVVAITADTLWLDDSHNGRIAIARATLTAVDLQVHVERASPAAYAVLGLTVGAAVGALIGRATTCAGPPRCETNNWGSAFGMLGGGALGLVGGVAVRRLRTNVAWEPLPLR